MTADPTADDLDRRALIVEVLRDRGRNDGMWAVSRPVRWWIVCRALVSIILNLRGSDWSDDPHEVGCMGGGTWSTLDGEMWWANVIQVPHGWWRFGYRIEKVGP